EEGRFLRFDRFMQQHPELAAEPLPPLIRAYVAEVRSPACQMERVQVGRILARELQRSDPTAPAPPAFDRLVKRAMIRERRRPHIYSAEEIERLLRTARDFPSPKAPLRPQTLYTMLEIGRASCRERGKSSRVALGLKEKK